MRFPSHCIFISIYISHSVPTFYLLLIIWLARDFRRALKCSLFENNGSTSNFLNKYAGSGLQGENIIYPSNALS